jgi:death-on-curing protein
MNGLMCIKDLPTPKFIGKDVVLEIHRLLIERFGGAEGIKDEGLLDSALAQPRQSFFGELLHPTISDQVSAYIYHIAKNHAFHDGNKRTALAVAITFLKVNGYKLLLPKRETENLVLDVVEGKLTKEQVAGILKSSIAREDQGTRQPSKKLH